MVVPNYLLEKGTTMFYVYKTVNKVNGKYYIGKHKGELDDEYLGSGLVIQQAIEKYGKDSFEKEILIICITEQEVRYWEKRIIDLNIDNPKCYNIAPGGQGGYVTRYLSDEEKAKIRKKASTKIKQYRREHPEEVAKWQKKQRITLFQNIEKHKQTIKQSLANRTEKEITAQHRKITKRKLQNGYYSIYQLFNPKGKMVMESIGAESIAKEYKVSANGIRLAANHGNPIKRGNLTGYKVVKKK